MKSASVATVVFATMAYLYSTDVSAEPRESASSVEMLEQEERTGRFQHAVDTFSGKIAKEELEQEERTGRFQHAMERFGGKVGNKRKHVAQKRKSVSPIGSPERKNKFLTEMHKARRQSGTTFSNLQKEFPPKNGEAVQRKSTVKNTVAKPPSSRQPFYRRSSTKPLQTISENDDNFPAAKYQKLNDAKRPSLQFEHTRHGNTFMGVNTLRSTSANKQSSAAVRSQLLTDPQKFARPAVDENPAADEYHAVDEHHTAEYYHAVDEHPTEYFATIGAIPHSITPHSAESHSASDSGALKSPKAGQGDRRPSDFDLNRNMFGAPHTSTRHGRTYRELESALKA